jgi:hypothetical protein
MDPGRPPALSDWLLDATSALSSAAGWRRRRPSVRAEDGAEPAPGDAQMAAEAMPYHRQRRTVCKNRLAVTRTWLSSE